MNIKTQRQTTLNINIYKLIPRNNSPYRTDAISKNTAQTANYLCIAGYI